MKILTFPLSLFPKKNDKGSYRLFCFRGSHKPGLHYTGAKATHNYCTVHILIQGFPKKVRSQHPGLSSLTPF